MAPVGCYVALVCVCVSIRLAACSRLGRRKPQQRCEAVHVNWRRRRQQARTVARVQYERGCEEGEGSGLLQRIEGRRNGLCLLLLLLQLRNTAAAAPLDEPLRDAEAYTNSLPL